MNMSMAELNEKLPPHCQIKKRGKYSDVYFMPHPKDRPEKWPETIKLGRTDRNTPAEIHKRASEVYQEYIVFRTGGEQVKEGSFPDLIAKYKSSPFWKDLSPRTRYDYGLFLKEVEDWSRRAAHPHIGLLTPRSIVKFLGKWSEAPRRQKYAKAVMSVLYGMAVNEGYVNANIVREIRLRRRKPENRKKIHIWSEEDIDRFVSECDERGLYSLGSIVLTGIETAQRQADVIRMRSGIDYQNGRLNYVQQKTGKTVPFNATEKLRKRLSKHPSKQLFMFVNERTKKPWRGQAVAKELRKICNDLEMNYHVYAHLRHSQVYYLNELELSRPIIRSITGHSEASIDQMLDGVYLESRNEKLANKGIAKINRVRQKVRREVRQKMRTKGGNPS